MKRDISDKELAVIFCNSFEGVVAELGKVIVGQENVLKYLLISIFCEGHCILVGVPGLAKTLLIKCISQVLELAYSRVQFTPDLMPSDILGSEIIDEERNFKFIKGPIFSNIILADEINRTPPKTQSALLESMQEYSVTIAGKHYSLDKPFFVLATQNPIEQEGTYPLPEAQLDRFMFHLNLTYPSYEEEINVVKRTTSAIDYSLNSLLSLEELLDFQSLVRRTPIVDNVISYAVKLVNKTRPNSSYADEYANNYLEWGAGPRASQYLVLGAKCHALISGKYSPDIEDVKAMAIPVLRHRLVRNFKAETDNIDIEDIIRKLL